jgi:hypothetical protein
VVNCYWLTAPYLLLLFKPFVFIDAAMLVRFLLAYRKLSAPG